MTQGFVQLDFNVAKLLHGKAEFYEMTYENVNRQGYEWISHLVTDDDELAITNIYALDGEILDQWHTDLIDVLEPIGAR